ncbi:tetratricopeptide repeat protein [Actinoplanes sp. NPDC051470]|uniref:tetratricopeptide repeat protein n=1 Tax=Actinoplanes sp. NPDC051470 TaxID=3157224 RepID=UPI0034152955
MASARPPTLSAAPCRPHPVGRTADALTHHTDAHTIASRDQQARALTGLGHAHHALGNLDLAREHYQHALVLWTDLGLPEADQTRVRLSTLATSSNGTAGISSSLQERSLL